MPRRRTQADQLGGKGPAAVLAIGIGGSFLGSAIGIGSSLGFLAGTILGNILFPPSPIVSEGPRLGDLNVTFSTYGGVIPLGFGTVRMAGNGIWSAGIEEVESREKVGGKGALGGPSQEQVSYTYFASFAIAFAKGPAEDVLRIWADGKLIYDKQGAGEITVKHDLKFRKYLGTEDQLPDSLIEDDVGAGQAPAHRGLVYLVFEDLELTDYGNRIPNITAEIAFKSTATNSYDTVDNITTAEGGLFDSFDVNEMAVDHKRRLLYQADLSGTRGLRVIDITAMAETRQQSEGNILIGGGDTLTGAFAVDDDGNIFATVTTSNRRPIIKIDPDTLTEVARFGTASVETDSSSDGFNGAAFNVTAFGIDPVLGERVSFLLSVGTTNSKLGVLRARDMSFVYANNSGPQNIQGAVGLRPASIGLTGFWLADHSGGDTDLNIYRLDMTIHSFQDTVQLNLIDTVTSSAWNDDAAMGAEIRGPVLDPADGGLIFAIDLASGGSQVFKWREGEGVVWSSAAGTSAPISFNATAFYQAGRPQGSRFAFVDKTEKGSLVDTADGSVTDFDLTTISGFDGAVSRSQFYDGATGAVYFGHATTAGTVSRVFLGKAQGQGAAVADIVEAVSAEVGLSASDLDTTALTQTVKGYVVSRQASARRAIEPLATAFFFEGVEEDDVVRFINRGGAPADTIPEDHLIELGDDAGEVLAETRAQEVELPERIYVAYLDQAADYQQGVESEKRVPAPVPVMRARAEETAELPMVLAASEAAQIAEKLLFTAWNERTSVSFRVPAEYLGLTPGDVVTLILNSGTTIRARIAKAAVNLDLSISIDAVREDGETFVSDSDADGALGVPPAVAPGAVETLLYLLDIPLLRDVDATSGTVSRLHLTMAGFRSSWSGATLFDSGDGTIFTSTGIRQRAAPAFGTVENKLPDTEYPFQTDEITVLKVWLRQGQLESVTETEFLDNANVALVGDPDTGNWEVILFRDAVLDGDGAWRVSGIMRGRRGTEVQAGSHGNAETFIAIDRASMAALSLELAELDVTRYYRAVGFGQLLEDADVHPFQHSGNDLKPYAPGHVEATLNVSENIDITWVRRTRVGGALRDVTGTVPLAEDSEAYEVEVLDGPGGSVLRTFTGLTTPAVEYTKAQYQADGIFGNAVPLSLVNPGAEAGDTSGWTDETGALQAVTGPTGDGTLPHSGSYFFYGGNNALTVSRQDIAVPASEEALIDAGDARIAWRHWIAGSANDRARVRLEFFDGAVVSLGTSDPAYVTAPGGNNWQLQENEAAIPANTRTIRFFIDMDRLTGTSNDGYIDDITAEILGLPSQLTLKVYQISAQVGRGFTNEETVNVQ